MTDSGSIDGIGFFDKMNPVWAVQSMFVETDFESRSHEEMIEMVKASDPGTTRRLGQKLIDAATDMDAIATELETRGQRVQWEGEGADSFTKWNTDMASSTRRLATFSRTSGQALQGAADTLQEVKRDMPQYPESARLTLNDYLMQNPGGMAKLDQAASSKGSSSPGGPSAKEAADAKQQLENGHGEAVRQMRKLSTSYALSNTTINSSERPTFPPMPGELMPEQSNTHWVNETTYRSGSPTSSTASSPGGGGAWETAVGAPAGGQPAPTSGRVANSSMALDGGVRIPEVPSAPASHLPSGQDGPSRATSPPQGLGPAVPGYPGQRTVGQGSSNKGPAPTGKGAPRLPAVGSGGHSPTSGPRAGGSRVPTDHGNGVYGGRPTQGGSGQPTHGLPRSNAIGAGGNAGQTAQGRPPLAGRPVAGGIPGAGSGATSSGVVGGRPLAKAPGGRVGTNASAALFEGKPFTPGGRGLTRAGRASGHGDDGRPVVRGASGEERRDDRQRPDYPVEDEETWQPEEGRPVTPPVVE